jgi:hypothetical protein
MQNKGRTSGVEQSDGTCMPKRLRVREGGVTDHALVLIQAMHTIYYPRYTIQLLYYIKCIVDGVVIRQNLPIVTSQGEVPMVVLSQIHLNSTIQPVSYPLND